MNAYALLKNGKHEYFEATLKNCKKYSHGEIEVFLLECWHPIFGFFYVTQKYKEFKKLLSYKNPKVSYMFLDGILVENEDEEYLFVKNKYYYRQIDQLFAKMLEIYINENIFNDSFWIYDSFFQYIYDDIKVNVKTKKKKKKSFKGNAFYSKFINHKPIIKKNFLTINETNKSKSSKDIVFSQIYPNIWFRIDSKIFDIGKFKIDSKIILTYIDEYDESILNERYFNSKNQSDMMKLKIILETYISRYVIGKLENGVYKVKTTVKFKNKKINSMKYKFNKFVRKYFIDINK